MGDEIQQRAARAELRAVRVMTEAVEQAMWARALWALSFGLSADDIAQELGVSRATVYRHIRQVHGWEIPDSSQD